MVWVPEILEHMQDACVHRTQPLVKPLLWNRLIAEVEIESVSVIRYAVCLKSIP